MPGYKIKFNGIDRLYNEYSWRLTRRAKEVWQSGNVLQGQHLQKFEKALAKKYSRKYAVAVASATDGLYFALRCAGVGQHDTVICPALSYIATSGAIKRTGAGIDFVDTDRNGNIDPTKISNMSIPKALLYVNLFGNTAEYDSLRKYCESRDTVLIEDAAQSQGASYGKKMSGTLGDISVFSFDPMKNMPSFGGGGALLTDNDEYFEKAISLRRHGLGTNIEYGYNSLISDDHANQLCFLLDKFDKLQKLRNKAHARYVKNLPQIDFIRCSEYNKSSHHKLVMLVDDRDRLKQYLANHGIETKIHYSKTLDAANSYPQSESICKRALSLPIYPFLKNSEIDYVCDHVRKFYNV
jgi:dTDP-4-amino-4,6-dideoxygalactose transaminase